LDLVSWRNFAGIEAQGLSLIQICKLCFANLFKIFDKEELADL
jgi:hypothetical protein